MMNYVLVRGRFKRNLETLQQMIKKEEQLDLELSVTPQNDYHYQLNVSKDVWGRVCQKLAEGITYHNLKNRVHGELSRNQAYMRCWAAIYGAQLNI
jgi:hypothetical protein